MVHGTENLLDPVLNQGPLSGPSSPGPKPANETSTLLGISQLTMGTVLGGSSHLVSGL
jgi:hypothetical protein